MRALVAEEEYIAKNPEYFFYKDGFEKHASRIQRQIKEKGFCSRAQLQFLMLYNEKCDFEDRLLVEKSTLKDTKIFTSKEDGQF